MTCPRILDENKMRWKPSHPALHQYQHNHSILQTNLASEVVELLLLFPQPVLQLLLLLLQARHLVSGGLLNRCQGDNLINEDQTSSWSAPLFSRSATSLPRLLILSSLYSTSSFIAWTFVLSQGCKTSFSFMTISYFDLRLWMWQPECDTVWHKGRSLSREHPPFHIQAGWSNIQHSTVLVTVKSITIADRAIVNPDNVFVIISIFVSIKIIRIVTFPHTRL